MPREVWSHCLWNCSGGTWVWPLGTGFGVMLIQDLKYIKAEILRYQFRKHRKSEAVKCILWYYNQKSIIIFMAFPCSFFPFPSALDWEYYQSFSWQNALTRITFRAAQWSLLLQHWHSLHSCFALSELFQWNFSGKSWLKSDWNFTSTIIFDNFNTEIKINTKYSHKKVKAVLSQQKTTLKVFIL